MGAVCISGEKTLICTLMSVVISILPEVQWQIQRTHERGIAMEDIYIDASGDMRYQATHKSVFQGRQNRPFFLAIIPSFPVPRDLPS